MMERFCVYVGISSVVLLVSVGGTSVSFPTGKASIVHSKSVLKLFHSSLSFSFFLFLSFFFFFFFCKVVVCFLCNFVALEYVFLYCSNFIGVV